MSVAQLSTKNRMLNVHYNTVQREGKRENEEIHIHWHVNIQAEGICF